MRTIFGIQCSNGPKQKKMQFFHAFFAGALFCFAASRMQQDRFRWFSPFCVKLQFFKLCMVFVASFLLRGVLKLLSRDDNGRYEKSVKPFFRAKRGSHAHPFYD